MSRAVIPVISIFSDCKSIWHMSRHC